MIRLSSAIVAGLCLLLLCSGLLAQSRPAGRRAVLVTLGPGDEIYEKFGHNMIWVIDPSRNYEACYNWGLFSFDEPGFIAKFIQGDMTYWMAALDPQPVFAEYLRQNRHLRLQELDLTAAEFEDLLRRCETNRLPENRHYAYDYYRQNCSTKVRDMLDAVTGGRLSASMKDKPAPSGLTYRGHTMRAATDDVWMSLGMDLLLGPYADRPLSAWDECFLPAKLAEAAGPIVAGDVPPLWQSTRPPEPTTVPKRTGVLALSGVVFAFVLLMAGLGNRRWTRVFARLLLAGWWTLTGVAGGMMVFLWAFTRHAAAYANQNLWHFSLLGGVALVLAIASWKWPKAWRVVVWATTTAAVLSAVGLLLKAVGLGGQANWGFVLFAFPLNVAAMVVTRLMQKPIAPRPQPGVAA